MKTLIFAVLSLVFVCVPVQAQRYMVYGGYGWGTYRYWGFNGRTGGYYNPGQYQWSGFRPWHHRNYY